MKLIVALDYHEKKPALALVSQLNPLQCALKVGLEMYTRFGPEWVHLLVNQGFKVFLDLKFHDIPHTVAQACHAAADLGVWMINVHTLGGLHMLHAAKEALTRHTSPPLLIGVTVLTSLADMDLVQLGMRSSLDDTTIQLADLAHQVGLDGVVCPAMMAGQIRRRYGKKFLTVTPGIRLPEDKKHDQQQILTPQEAIAAGSDYVVMGRSITESPEPHVRLNTILNSMS